MKELHEIINNKFQQMLNENVIQEAIEESIEERIEGAIKEAIHSQLSRDGSLTNQIEKALSKGLQLNLKELPFESYNKQMLVAVKQKVGAMFANEASAKFMQEIDRVLKPVPQEMSIKELIEAVIIIWKSDARWNFDELDDQATVELEKDDRFGSNSYTLKMWKQKYRSSSFISRQHSDLKLFIIGGEIRISHNQRYNPTCFSEEQTLVFKLYSAGTLITGLDEFDPCECDLTLIDSEY